MLSCRDDGLVDLEKSIHLLLKGQKEGVQLGKIPEGHPPWFDESKYLAGLRMVDKYYGGILVAHIASLTLLVYSPQVLKPLIFTGKSETPEKSYRRYVSTSVHVLSWYRGDIWKPGSKARQSLQYVRNLHSNAAVNLNSAENRPLVDKINISNCGEKLDRGRPLIESIRDDLKSTQSCPFRQLLEVNNSLSSPYLNQVIQLLHLYKDFILISLKLQFDMSGTQFAFVALIVLHPEKFGMRRATEEELEGFVHLWRCLGWILGIQDEYNFCRFNTLSDTRRWTEYCMNRLVLPWLRDSLSPEYEHMGRAVILGAKPYFPFSYEALYLYIGSVLDIPMPNVERRISPFQRDGCRRLNFLFGWFFNLPLANWVLNAAVYLSLKVIVDPPRYWPFRRGPPPPVWGLKEFFYSSRIADKTIESNKM